MNCRTPKKRAYRSRRAAETALRQAVLTTGLLPWTPAKLYRCGDYWHLSSHDGARGRTRRRR